MVSKYQQNGYLVVDGIFNEQDISTIGEALSDTERVGTRTMLEMDWCVCIAKSIQERITAHDVDLKNKKPVQCSYFQKHSEKNWLVSWHQDRSLPVHGVRGNSNKVRVKDGQPFYQPSEAVLSQAVAVRLSIDDSHSLNGGLKIIPKSHTHGILSDSEIERATSTSPVEIPTVPRGSVLVMSPLLLHSSSMATVPDLRRILHFTYI